MAIADITSVHLQLLETKAYRDMTGNNINHPNDFLTRIYAQVIMEVFEAGSIIGENDDPVDPTTPTDPVEQPSEKPAETPAVGETGTEPTTEDNQSAQTTNGKQVDSALIAVIVCIVVVTTALVVVVVKNYRLLTGKKD